MLREAVKSAISCKRSSRELALREDRQLASLKGQIQAHLSFSVILVHRSFGTGMNSPSSWSTGSISSKHVLSRSWRNARPRTSSVMLISGTNERLGGISLVTPQEIGRAHV